MALSTEPQFLDIADAPKLRYSPLPGFACARYVEDHAHLLESSGVFDTLKYGTAELRISEDALDIAGLASLASAFTQALAQATKDSNTLETLIVDHCKRFKVEVLAEPESGQWEALDTADKIEAHLDFGQMLDVVFALAGGVLRPLWSRLRSAGVAKHNESPKPSTNDTPAS